METFGERLAKLRLRKGLSQAELAERLNIAKSTLAMYETDKREPSFEVVKKLAEFFDVTTDYLIRGVGVRQEAISPEQAEFLKWVEENLKGVFFHEFHGTPEEMKEEAMETLRLWWEMEKRRAQRRRKREEDTNED